MENRFANTYKFSSHHINQFTLLLQKGVYTYEYMGDWKKFKEKSLPNKNTLLKWEKALETEYVIDI